MIYQVKRLYKTNTVHWALPSGVQLEGFKADTGKVYITRVFRDFSPSDGESYRVYACPLAWRSPKIAAGVLRDMRGARGGARALPGVSVYAKRDEPGLYAYPDDESPWTYNSHIVPDDWVTII